MAKNIVPAISNVLINFDGTSVSFSENGLRFDLEGSACGLLDQDLSGTYPDNPAFATTCKLSTGIGCDGKWAYLEKDLSILTVKPSVIKLTYASPEIVGSTPTDYGDYGGTGFIISNGSMQIFIKFINNSNAPIQYMKNNGTWGVITDDNNMSTWWNNRQLDQYWEFDLSASSGPYAGIVGCIIDGVQRIASPIADSLCPATIPAGIRVFADRGTNATVYTTASIGKLILSAPGASYTYCDGIAGQANDFTQSGNGTVTDDVQEENRTCLKLDSGAVGDSIEISRQIAGTFRGISDFWTRIEAKMLVGAFNDGDTLEVTLSNGLAEFSIEFATDGIYALKSDRTKLKVYDSPPVSSFNDWYIHWCPGELSADGCGIRGIYLGDKKIVSGIASSVAGRNESDWIYTPEVDYDGTISLAAAGWTEGGTATAVTRTPNVSFDGTNCLKYSISPSNTGYILDKILPANRAVNQKRIKWEARYQFVNHSFTSADRCALQWNNGAYWHTIMDNRRTLSPAWRYADDYADGGYGQWRFYDGKKSYFFELPGSITTLNIGWIHESVIFDNENKFILSYSINGYEYLKGPLPYDSPPVDNTNTLRTLFYGDSGSGYDLYIDFIKLSYGNTAPSGYGTALSDGFVKITLKGNTANRQVFFDKLYFGRDGNLFLPTPAIYTEENDTSYFDVLSQGRMECDAQDPAWTELYKIGNPTFSVDADPDDRTYVEEYSVYGDYRSYVGQKVLRVDLWNNDYPLFYIDGHFSDLSERNITDGSAVLGGYTVPYLVAAKETGTDFPFDENEGYWINTDTACTLLLSNFKFDQGSPTNYLTVTDGVELDATWDSSGSYGVYTKTDNDTLSADNSTGWCHFVVGDNGTTDSKINYDKTFGDLSTATYVRIRTTIHLISLGDIYAGDFFVTCGNGNFVFYLWLIDPGTGPEVGFYDNSVGYKKVASLSYNKTYTLEFIIDAQSGSEEVLEFWMDEHDGNSLQLKAYNLGTPRLATFMDDRVLVVAKSGTGVTTNELYFKDLVIDQITTALASNSKGILRKNIGQISTSADRIYFDIIFRMKGYGNALLIPIAFSATHGVLLQFTEANGGTLYYTNSAGSTVELASNLGFDTSPHRIRGSLDPTAISGGAGITYLIIDEDENKEFSSISDSVDTTYGAYGAEGDVQIRMQAWNVTPCHCEILQFAFDDKPYRELAIKRNIGTFSDKGLLNYIHSIRHRPNYGSGLTKLIFSNGATNTELVMTSAYHPPISRAEKYNESSTYYLDNEGVRHPVASLQSGGYSRHGLGIFDLSCHTPEGPGIVGFYGHPAIAPDDFFLYKTSRRINYEGFEDGDVVLIFRAYLGYPTSPYHQTYFDFLRLGETLSSSLTLENKMDLLGGYDYSQTMLATDEIINVKIDLGFTIEGSSSIELDSPDYLMYTGLDPNEDIGYTFQSSVLQTPYYSVAFCPNAADNQNIRFGLFFYNDINNPWITDAQFGWAAKGYHISVDGNPDGGGIGGSLFKPAGTDLPYHKPLFKYPPPFNKDYVDTLGVISANASTNDKFLSGVSSYFVNNDNWISGMGASPNYGLMPAVSFNGKIYVGSYWGFSNVSIGTRYTVDSYYVVGSLTYAGPIPFQITSNVESPPSEYNTRLYYLDPDDPNKLMRQRRGRFRIAEAFATEEVLSLRLYDIYQWKAAVTLEDIPYILYRDVYNAKLMLSKNLESIVICDTPTQYFTIVADRTRAAALYIFYVDNSDGHLKYKTYRAKAFEPINEKYLSNATILKKNIDIAGNSLQAPMSVNTGEIILSYITSTGEARALPFTFKMTKHLSDPESWLCWTAGGVEWEPFWNGFIAENYFNSRKVMIGHNERRTPEVVSVPKQGEPVEDNSFILPYGPYFDSHNKASGTLSSDKYIYVAAGGRELAGVIEYGYSENVKENVFAYRSAYPINDPNFDVTNFIDITGNLNNVHQFLVGRGYKALHPTHDNAIAMFFAYSYHYGVTEYIPGQGWKTGQELLSTEYSEGDAIGDNSRGNAGNIYLLDIKPYNNNGTLEFHVFWTCRRFVQSQDENGVWVYDVELGRSHAEILYTKLIPNGDGTYNAYKSDDTPQSLTVYAPDAEVVWRSPGFPYNTDCIPRAYGYATIMDNGKPAVAVWQQKFAEAASSTARWVSNDSVFYYLDDNGVWQERIINTNLFELTGLAYNPETKGMIVVGTREENGWLIPVFQKSTDNGVTWSSMQAAPINYYDDEGNRMHVTDFRVAGWYGKYFNVVWTLNYNKPIQSSSSIGEVHHGYMYFDDLGVKIINLKTTWRHTFRHVARGKS